MNIVQATYYISTSFLQNNIEHSSDGGPLFIFYFILMLIMYDDPVSLKKQDDEKKKYWNILDRDKSKLASNIIIVDKPAE